MIKCWKNVVFLLGMTLACTQVHAQTTTEEDPTMCTTEFTIDPTTEGPTTTTENATTITTTRTTTPTTYSTADYSTTIEEWTTDPTTTHGSTIPEESTTTEDSTTNTTYDPTATTTEEPPTEPPSEPPTEPPTTEQSTTVPTTSTTDDPTTTTEEPTTTDSTQTTDTIAIIIAADKFELPPNRPRTICGQPPTSPPTNSTTVTPRPSSTTTTTTTTTPPPCSCNNVRCIATDARNQTWNQCPGTTENKTCPAGSDGLELWTCDCSGKFTTPQPDDSGCNSRWIKDALDMAENIQNLTDVEDVMSNIKNNITVTDGDKRPNYHGHEIQVVLVDLLHTVVQKASNLTNVLEEFEPIADDVVDIIYTVTQFPDPWVRLENKNRSRFATTLLQNIESVSFNLTGIFTCDPTFSTRTGEFVHHFNLSDSYFVTTALISNNAGDDPPEFPIFNMSKGSVLRLPPNWGRQISGKVDWTGSLIATEYANYMLPLQSEETRETIYNGNVLSFTVSRTRTSSSCNSPDEDRTVPLNFTNGEGVQIRFPHNVEAWGDKTLNLHRDLKPGEIRKAARGSARCVFWDTVNLVWSTEGCKVIASSKFETTCECDHLTSFTILMDLHNYEGADAALKYLTYTLCPISIVCLILCVFLFSTIISVKNERMLITRNLCCCLIVGNIFVLTTLNNPTFMNQTACFVFGFLTHYVFLAAFCWMALEGWHLYKMIINVFNNAAPKRSWVYYAIGYGAPLVMVGITLLIGFIIGEGDAYGGEVCWLADSFIWAFNGPVLIVVVMNIIILTLCMVTAHRIRTSKQFPMPKRRISSITTWARGCFALSILLGSTWIFGFFALIPGAELVFSYIFVILNASQGIFIFVFRVILDKQMRQKCVSKLLQTRFGEHLPKSCLNWRSSSNMATSNETNLNHGASIGTRK